MIKLESQRLYLYPITDEEMKMLIVAEAEPDMKQAYSEMLEGCLREPENRIWFAVWNIELKETPGCIVGDFCFKGLSADGSVEIGYGLYNGYCRNGYMTEAVRKVTEWAIADMCVTAVEAETAPDNSASQKVLLNCGFKPTGVIGEEGPRYRFDGKDT